MLKFPKSPGIFFFYLYFHFLGLISLFVQVTTYPKARVPGLATQADDVGCAQGQRGEEKKTHESWGAETKSGEEKGGHCGTDMNDFFVFFANFFSGSVAQNLLTFMYASSFLKATTIAVIFLLFIIYTYSCTEYRQLIITARSVYIYVYSTLFLFNHFGLANGNSGTAH